MLRRLVCLNDQMYEAELVNWETERREPMIVCFLCKSENARASEQFFEQILRCFKVWRPEDGHRFALFSISRARLVWLYRTDKEKGVAVFANWRPYLTHIFLANSTTHSFSCTCCTRKKKPKKREYSAFLKKKSAAWNWFLCLSKPIDVMSLNRTNSNLAAKVGIKELLKTAVMVPYKHIPKYWKRVLN